MNLRHPDIVMKLARLGSFHQCGLSFMRSLLRQLQREKWQFNRHKFAIDANNTGYAVYTMRHDDDVYSLVAFAHDLPDDMRTDRVIATRWDATFTLYDGIPTDDDIKRLEQHVPYQESGRVSQKELVLARANRSVRLWNKICTLLAQGQQPQPDDILQIGYIMRTSAVYGSAKFGTEDYQITRHKNLFSSAFRAEMLCVYLIRQFSVDLLNHAAKNIGKDNAVALDKDLQRLLGIGNSTGLGMAPFLMHHPALFHHWINTREELIAKICQCDLSDEKQQCFKNLLQRAYQLSLYNNSQHDIQIAKKQQLLKDLHHMQHVIDDIDSWQEICDFITAHYSLEGQEMILSLMIDCYPELYEPMADKLYCDENEGFIIDGNIIISDLHKIVHHNYHWALSYDMAQPDNRARFWYISEEKLEPRLGERWEEEGADTEYPFDIILYIQQLLNDTKQCDENMTLAEFLSDYPQHRYIIRRILYLSDKPYGEIRDNLVDKTMMPIDLLRCKLSFFGATQFDPRSDRWLRICMYQHAPMASELHQATYDDWVYPPS